LARLIHGSLRGSWRPIEQRRVHAIQKICFWLCRETRLLVVGLANNKIGILVFSFGLSLGCADRLLDKLRDVWLGRSYGFLRWSLERIKENLVGCIVWFIVSHTNALSCHQ
jgi:hypothetical protein